METKPKDSDEYYDSRNKNSDEMFCYSCGSIIKINSNSCPKCGVSNRYKYIPISTTKEKETAILLSIVTSFFVWLYLYDKGAIKFWVGLITSVVSAVTSKIVFDSQISYWYLFLIPLLIVWVFAIIDTAIKNNDYFKSFGGN